MIDCKQNGACTGCKACGDICPVGAIRFTIDSEGFWYPEINPNKCIKCGLCTQICPVSKENEVKEKIEGKKPSVYAAWSKNIEIRHESTSGGIFWELATKVINQGGIVIGSCYGDDWKSATHCVAKNKAELEKLRGSKYFQSDTEGIYKFVKTQAEEGKLILFCGSPCQVDAMHFYLRKEYKNVIFMDFICLGINSPKVFKKYIEEQEKINGGKTTYVQLKNKKYGWESLSTRIKFDNGKEIILDKNRDWWVKGFISEGLYMRKSCFKCQYRTIPRKTADITVGDFWGIRGVNSRERYEGISVVLVNTTKGEELFNSISEHIVKRPQKLEDVITNNPALVKDFNSNINRDKFFSELDNNEFSVALLNSVKKEKRKSEIKQIIKKITDGKGKISIIKFVYYNFFCKNVKRLGNAFLIPYKNAKIDIHKTAHLYINGSRDLEIGINKLKSSKAETYVRMSRDAVWYANNGCGLFYGTTLEVQESALFQSGFFTANTGSVIIANDEINFGDDVMIGRNVLIYDSDFHQMLDINGKVKNSPSPVNIEGHVWLTNNVIVLKGTNIGSGSIVAAFTQLKGSFPSNSLIVNNGGVAKVIKKEVAWSRDQISSIYKRNKKIILFGYGEGGKRIYEELQDNIAYVIDNNVISEKTMTFDEFYKQHPNLSDDYVWAIASVNYNNQIYDLIRSKYPYNKIISV